MKVQSNQFVSLSSVAVQDEALQTAVFTGTNAAYMRRLAAMSETNANHGERLRMQAAAAKRRALANLPELLEQAEANLKANGVTVLWAADAEEARALIVELTQKHGSKLVAKSKSMATEEVSLNVALEAAGIATVETDLGEYILQLNKEAPSHIVAPVIHKTKESIRDIFEREIGMPPTDDAATMARFARGKLRETFLQADMGISGGNFIIAETGTLCLVTNEGNARMVTSLPPVHVALVGIEKIAATLEDYATLTQVLPRSGTGQKLTVYTHMINGPRQPNDPDGPEHVYVIFLDNGRSDIYNSEYAEALACIRCGACLNACPVYQVTGGHSYGWVYPGPIGAIVTPLLVGPEKASPLPYASTLCGACKQVCPVNIDIPRMLLALRRDLVASGMPAASERLGMKAWAFGVSAPRRYGLAGRAASFANRHFDIEKLSGPLSGWSKYRQLPKFAPQSFKALWAEQEGGASHE